MAIIDLQNPSDGQSNLYKKARFRKVNASLPQSGLSFYADNHQIGKEQAIGLNNWLERKLGIRMACFAHASG
ncbi:hypothetical protein [Paenibacillus barengoltzii]|uniref:hypothetical protein n=1 Tax=Paenibacillus barengoltzii TaxID=343517 RepID=UPI000A15AD03|nr:hypothetical protein [Paenibacillus barengoltzii]